MRSYDQRNQGLEEESSHRRHKPKTNSYSQWNRVLKRNDTIESLQRGLSVTAKYAGVVLGLIAVMSIPGAKNTPHGGNTRPVEATEKYFPTSSEKVATILSATSPIK